MRVLCLSLLLVPFRNLFAEPLPETEFLSFPPISKADHIRLRGDRRIVGDKAVFQLEIPRKHLWPSPRESGITLTGRVEAVNRTGDVVDTTRIVLPVTAEGRISGTHRPEATLDLTSADQDPLRIRVAWSSMGDHPLLQVPEWEVRKVGAELQQVSPEARDEMATWIEEANHLHMIWGKHPLWPNLDRALAQPETPYRNLAGFLIRAYANPHLRRRQPYTVYVPESLDLSKPAPLMILLHGSGGDYRNLVADFAAGQRFEKHPMLIANAGAYRRTEFRHMPLYDVKAIIEDMRRKYNVDPDRIYAQGISLGGRGVLDLAARLPDTFAAISSQGSYGVHHELMDPLFPMQTDPAAYRLAAKNDIRTWLPNLRTTPVEMVFGWNDTSTRPVGALAIAIRLQRLRIPVVERGFDSGHNLTLPDYDWASTREWFLKQTKERHPRRLTFRVDNLRHNRFAWLRVDALHDYSDVGHVEARLGSKGDIRVNTRNIAQMTYLPPESDPSETHGFPDAGRVWFFDPDGNETRPPDVSGPSLRKHPGQSGPMWNFYSDPVLIVYDDSGDEKQDQRLEFMANRISRTDATPDARFPVKAAADVSERERGSLNLLFVTFPGSTHSWSKRIPTPLPRAVKEARETETSLLLALRPSPWSLDRLVLVQEIGPRAAALSPYNLGLFQEPLQADWLLYGSGRRFKAAGVYKHDWSPGAWTQDSSRTRVITR